MSTKNQTADQTFKGLVVGLVGWICAKNSVPSEITISLLAVIPAFMAYISTKIGDPALASFLSGPKPE